MSWAGPAAELVRELSRTESARLTVGCKAMYLKSRSTNPIQLQCSYGFSFLGERSTHERDDQQYRSDYEIEGTEPVF